MKIYNTFLNDFKDKYKKSLSIIPFKKYKIISALIISLTFLLSLGTSLFYYLNFSNISIFNKLILAFIPSLLVTSFSFLIIVIYPNYKISVEKNRIEKGLIYTLSYMTVLANCGFSVDRIFKHAAEIEQNISIKKLMTSFIADITVLGFDIEQGLRRFIERCPSKIFSDVISSISNASWSSGDLKEVLAYHFEVISNKSKDETEKMINSLTVLSEIYVALMVIAPIMLIIMFTLLSVLYIGMGSMNTIRILNSITFILLPFTATGFIVILDTLRGAD
jgi:archaellum biogenesis protein FlaJ (TadC family)